jgi:hypothetical protein
MLALIKERGPDGSRGEVAEPVLVEHSEDGRTFLGGEFARRGLFGGAAGVDASTRAVASTGSGAPSSLRVSSTSSTMAGSAVEAIARGTSAGVMTAATASTCESSAAPFRVASSLAARADSSGDAVAPSVPRPQTATGLRPLG